MDPPTDPPSTDPPPRKRLPTSEEIKERIRANSLGPLKFHRSPGGGFKSSGGSEEKPSIEAYVAAFLGISVQNHRADNPKLRNPQEPDTKNGSGSDGLSGMDGDRGDRNDRNANHQTGPVSRVSSPNQQQPPIAEKEKETETEKSGTRMEPNGDDEQRAHREKLEKPGKPEKWEKPEKPEKPEKKKVEVVIISDDETNENSPPSSGPSNPPHPQPPVKSPHQHPETPISHRQQDKTADRAIHPNSEFRFKGTGKYNGPPPQQSPLPKSAPKHTNSTPADSTTRTGAHTPQHKQTPQKPPTPTPNPARTPSHLSPHQTPKTPNHASQNSPTFGKRRVSSIGPEIKRRAIKTTVNRSAIQGDINMSGWGFAQNPVASPSLSPLADHTARSPSPLSSSHVGENGEREKRAMDKEGDESDSGVKRRKTETENVSAGGVEMVGKPGVTVAALGGGETESNSKNGNIITGKREEEPTACLESSATDSDSESESFSRESDRETRKTNAEFPDSAAETAEKSPGTNGRIPSPDEHQNSESALETREGEKEGGGSKISDDERKRNLKRQFFPSESDSDDESSVAVGDDREPETNGENPGNSPSETGLAVPASQEELSNPVSVNPEIEQNESDASSTKVPRGKTNQEKTKNQRKTRKPKAQFTRETSFATKRQWLRKENDVLDSLEPSPALVQKYPQITDIIARMKTIHRLSVGALETPRTLKLYPWGLVERNSKTHRAYVAITQRYREIYGESPDAKDLSEQLEEVEGDLKKANDLLVKNVIKNDDAEKRQKLGHLVVEWLEKKGITAREYGERVVVMEEGPLKGQWGVVARKRIPRGTILGLYSGEYVLNSEFKNQRHAISEWEHSDMYLADAKSTAIKSLPPGLGELMINPFTVRHKNPHSEKYGNCLLMYMNDCRENPLDPANLDGLRQKERERCNVEMHDIEYYGWPVRVATTKKDVDEGEWLLWDYGDDYWKAKGDPGDGMFKLLKKVPDKVNELARCIAGLVNEENGK